MVSRHEAGSASGKEDNTGSSDQPKEHNSSSKKPTVPDPALKDAVAKALSMSTSSEATEENGRDTESPVSQGEERQEVIQQSETIESVEKRENEHDTSQTEPKPSQLAPQPQAPVESEDPLSPKRLERMMRVTGNDRPPLL
jgi:hypothetical protein